MEEEIGFCKYPTTEFVLHIPDSVFVQQQGNSICFPPQSEKLPIFPSLWLHNSQEA